MFKCCSKSIIDESLKTCDVFSNEKYCSDHKYIYHLEKPDKCSICMEHISKTEIHIECGHWFHKSCLNQTNKCKLCNKKLKQYEIQYFKSQELINLEHNSFEIILNDLNIIQNLTNEIMLNNRNNPCVIYSLYSCIPDDNYANFINYVNNFIETCIRYVSISIYMSKITRISKILFNDTYDKALLSIIFNILFHTDHNITSCYYNVIENVIMERINEIYNKL